MAIYQDNVREVFNNKYNYTYAVGQGYSLYPVGIFSNCIVYGNSTEDWWWIPNQGDVSYLPFLANGVKIRIRTCSYNKLKQ